MFPIVHFLVSVALFGILYPFFGFWSLAVFIGGFLIDVDHYLYWVIEKKKFNLIEAYRHQTKESVENNKKFKIIKERPIYIRWDRLHIFHVWEFWVLMLLLSFFHKFFLINFIGLAIHIILDFIELLKQKVYGRRAISYFGWLKRH